MGVGEYFALFCLLVGVSTGSDTPCIQDGGTCQMDWLPCSGGSYHSGLCSGSARRRCCKHADWRCTKDGGTCQMDWLTCSGSYQSGLCSGSARRRCCKPASTNPGSVNSCPGVRIYSRQEWGARSPKSTPSKIPTPVGLFFVHHTAGASCSTVTSCKSTAKQVQNFHMNTRKYNDVGYSFLVGEDGNVYEGRGWGVEGAHTRGYNRKSFAASVMGNFQNSPPNLKARQAVKALIRCGVDKGYIKGSYRLYGHRDVGSTACPGQAFYNVIRGWPNYSTSSPGK